MTQESIKIFFDGGSRGNPGPAAGAAYTDWQGGQERALFLEFATNNEAEYHGFLLAIELARSLQLPNPTFLGDSKLVVMQVSGEWQAKHPSMQQLKERALEALRSLPRWRIEWIPREKNSEADRIANEEMNRRMGIQPMESVPGNESLSSSQRPDVRPDIQKLNSLGAKAGFGDFKQLKVGGRDEFSRASLDSLAELLENFVELRAAFQARLADDRLTATLPAEARDKLLLNALRWSARGLLGDLSLRKVLVDLEITNNIKGKK